MIDLAPIKSKLYNMIIDEERALITKHTTNDEKGRVISATVTQTIHKHFSKNFIKVTALIGSVSYATLIALGKTIALSFPITCIIGTVLSTSCIVFAVCAILANRRYDNIPVPVNS